MKLITDGKYWAIKKGWLFPKYFDFKNSGFWWSQSNRYFLDCWTDNKEEAEIWFKRLTA